MRISIIPKYRHIRIDEIALKCDYSVPANIESAFWDDDAQSGKIQYNDGTPNQRLTSLPAIDNLVEAFYTAYGVKFLPKYHTWNQTIREFYQTPEQVAEQAADEAAANAAATAAAEAQAIKDAENASNPMSNITFEQAENYIDANVIDLPTAKEAMKQIVKLILART